MINQDNCTKSKQHDETTEHSTNHEHINND